MVKVSELKKIRAGWKRAGKKMVFTNGCFDLVHLGHIRYLKQAKSLGDFLVVGLNADASVRRIKGPKRPILPEEERAEILCAFRFVDYVVLFWEDTPEKLIRGLLPDILVKGADWAAGKIVGADLVLKNGGEVRRINFVQGKSTSAVIEEIVKRYRKPRRLKS